MPKAAQPPPSTPDGRYIVVRERLWRRSDPALGETARKGLVDDLMNARRAIAAARRAGNEAAERRRTRRWTQPSDS